MRSRILATAAYALLAVGLTPIGYALASDPPPTNVCCGDLPSVDGKDWTAPAP